MRNLFRVGGHGTLLGLINSFIHVIMYMYYMLSAIPSMQKYLWWKRYLTIMQIIQFLVVFCHTIQVQFQPNCNFPKSIASLLTLNAALFTYMFSSFYIKSYTRKSKAIASTAAAGETVIDDKKVVCDENSNVVNGDDKMIKRE